MITFVLSQEYIHCFSYVNFRSALQAVANMMISMAHPTLNQMNLDDIEYFATQTALFLFQCEKIQYTKV